MWDSVCESIFARSQCYKHSNGDLIRSVAPNFFQTTGRLGARLLEVGCEPSANLWCLARKGFSSVGIDGLQMAIDRAASRLAAECPGLHARGELRVVDIARVAKLGRRLCLPTFAIGSWRDRPSNRSTKGHGAARNRRSWARAFLGPPPRNTSWCWWRHPGRRQQVRALIVTADSR